jgi:hypothetical protein
MKTSLSFRLKLRIFTVLKSNSFELDDSVKDYNIFKTKSASYVEQSRRSITTRFNDHHRNIRKNHPELSSIANHVISHMNDPRSKHDINLDNFSLLKEIRIPDHLDAFESYYILKAKKEGKLLLNNDDQNVNSTMKSNAKQLLNFLISLTRTLSEDGSLAPEIN